MCFVVLFYILIREGGLGWKMEIIIKNVSTDEVEIVNINPEECLSLFETQMMNLFGMEEGMFELEYEGEILNNKSFQRLDVNSEINLHPSKYSKALLLLQSAGYTISDIDLCIKNNDVDNFNHFITLDNYDQKTIVGDVCENGFTEGMRTLFHKTTLLSNLTEELQHEVVMQASGSNSPTAHDVVELLIENKFATLLCNETALESAASTGTLRTMRLLVETNVPGGDPTIHNSDCALSASVSSRDKSKIDFMAEVHPHSCIPTLIAACEQGCVYSASLSLRMGTHINSTNYLSHTPLSRACRSGFLNCIAFLICKGANIDVRDREGVSPIMEATRCHRWRPEIADLLYEARMQKKRRQFDKWSSDLIQTVNRSWSC